MRTSPPQSIFSPSMNNDLKLELNSDLGLIQIRKMKQSELPAVIDLNLQEWGANCFGSPEKARAITEQQYADILRHTLVAVAGDKVIATASLVLDDVYRVYGGINMKENKLGYFSRLVTAKDCRGKGIASALLKATDQLAAKLGCEKIFLLMTEGKESDLFRFYNKKSWGNTRAQRVKGQDKYGNDIDFGECLIIEHSIQNASFKPEEIEAPQQNKKANRK